MPRIPLNLVMLKGSRILGFSIGPFIANAPEEAARNEAELLALLAGGRARPLAEAGAALRHVADGKATGEVVLEIR